jgi:hypothetical protein
VEEPEAVKLTGEPPGIQIVPVEGVTEMLGVGFTVTVTLVEQLEPQASVTVTVKV